MFGFFILLFLFSVVLLIIGLIKPSIFQRITKTVPSRGKILLVIGGLIFCSFVGMLFTAPPVDISNEKESIVQPQNQEVADQPSAEVPTVSTTTAATSVATNAEVTAKPLVQTQDSTSSLYAVSSVVDGDTIKVNINGTIKTIRLIGINTPEVVDPRKPVECFGKEASTRAKELLTGKKVRLESDPTQGDLDKYNRLLRYVYLEDSTSFNEKMIKDGYAYEYTYNTPYKYQVEFKAAQKEAEENQRGLWSPNTCNGSLTLITSQVDASKTSTATQTTNLTQTSSGKYYTSSFGGSEHYYPESCSAWKSLSTKYLKVFDSLEALLKAYPSRTLSPQC